MFFSINTNIEAFAAHRNLTRIASEMSKSMQRLSTGLRINSAADDPAGLIISERMRGQIRGLEQANRNAMDGIGMLNVADGVLDGVTSILHRMRELTVRHENSIGGQDARNAIKIETDELAAELERMIKGADYNGIKILNNSDPNGDVILQVGANSGDTVNLGRFDVLDATTGIDLNAIKALDLDALDAAISNVSTIRGEIGAKTNRLEHTINANDVTQENLMAAESRIRDVDVAKEIANLTKLQIQQQFAMAMMAQAFQNKQNLLQLLQ